MALTFWLNQVLVLNVLGVVTYCGGRLVRDKGVRVNYTRKINHFTLFFTPLFVDAVLFYERTYHTAIASLVLTCLAFGLYVEPVRTRVPIVRTMFLSFDRPEDRPHTLLWLYTQVFVAIDYTEEVVTEGDVPIGNLFDITTHEQYTGDLGVTVYLLNTGSLVKAYNYVNIKLELEDSVEGTYQPLTFNNGVATFKLEGCPGATRTLSVTGGSYSLVSGNPAEWQPGWSIVPELHCEITQR